jgi:uncharacterized protein (TIGR03435 family)
MQELDDIALLREYVERGSEEAFAALVTRHINKVYSVALRHTRNPHQAEEITQAVFVILAKKSRDLGRRVILSGWLYQTARLTAVTFLRSEIRRARREQEAYMQTELNEADSALWTQIGPMLDAAIAGLNEADRQAVVLRFFDGKSMREVGAVLGANEAAAERRVSRALGKLQKFFFKRGVTSTTANIAETISANSVQVAPAMLAKSATAVALAKGAAASASTLTLIKGALKVMAWTKAKTAIVVGVVALAAVGATGVAFNVIFFKPSVEDVFKHHDNATFLKKAPSVVVLRPTQYANQGDWINGDGNRFLGRNRSMPWVLAAAYDVGPERMVLPVDLPTSRFDYLVTASSTPRAVLQNELKKQFGLVARTETRTTNVLVLKVHKYGVPGLKINTHINENSILIGNEEATLKGFPMSSVADSLGGYFVNTPVVDETGLTNRYDFTLRWKGDIGDADVMNQVLQNELGLELVPDQRPIEMLVVEFQNGPADYTPRAGSDLQGYWKGTELWGASPWPVVLKITEPTDGNFRAQFRNMWFNPQFAAAPSMTYNPPKVRVEFSEPTRVFEGEINSDHTAITGTLRYVNTNANSTPYPMTVKLTDPKEEAALDAQKDYSYRDPNDLAGHWKAKLDDSPWALDIARMLDGKFVCSLTQPGWNDGIEATLIQNNPSNLRLEWGYRRLYTFVGKIGGGKLTGTLQQNRKGTPRPIVFERIGN